MTIFAMMPLSAACASAERYDMCKFRRDHGDFEDNLIIAAGERANVDYIVTSDRQLLSRLPAIAITPQRACELIGQR